MTSQVPRDQAGVPVKGVLAEVTAWLGEGRPVALARVVEVVGSGVQPAGAALAVNADGQVAGSASGGCVEGALVQQTRAALDDDGRPRLASFGCTDDEAFDVGLTCGGTLRVLIERLDPPVPWLDALDQVLAAGAGAALVEVVDGPPGQLGAKVVVGEDGEVIFPVPPGRSTLGRSLLAGRSWPVAPGRSLLGSSPPAPSTTPWPTWPRGAVPPTAMTRRRGRTKRR